MPGSGPNLYPMQRIVMGVLQRVSIRALPQRLSIRVLEGYKLFVSPLLPSACRYRPTCSEYMMEAVQKHGVCKGAWMGMKRLGRCHPFHEGGYDPVR